MNIGQEIRAQIEKNKGLKLAVGEINNHLSILENLVRKDIMEQVDEAYQKGLEEGKKAFDLLDAERDSEYQRGLDDAWEAARKVVLSPDEGGTSLPILFAIFGSGSMQHVFRNFSASEAIEKLKAYEEKADDEIKVGDEVVWADSKCAVVFINRDIETSKIKDYDLLADDGSVAENISPDRFRKTGKHYDIDKILEEMRT